MIWEGWVQLFAGLLVLIIGGEFLVRAAVKLALFLRVSTAVIGLTVVSFGTSFPELMVSVNAAIGGHPDIAMGNVVGSNIANLALVLGLTALIFPLRVERRNLVVDWPIMIAASALLIAFGWDFTLQRWEAVILTFFIVGYNFWVIRASRRENAELDVEAVKRTAAELLRVGIIFAISLTALIFGADWLVEGAVVVARSFGVEERVIAVTIIAFGTSAPELATSIIAVYRREDGISVGNLIGSNIFNIFGILGLTGMIVPVSVHQGIHDVDFWWMLAIPVALYPLLLTRLKVSRVEGLALVTAYALYVYFLF